MPKNILSIVLPFSLLLGLLGCHSANKIIIKGDREEIFINDSGVEIDKGAAKEPVSLEGAVRLTSWPMTGGHPSHTVRPSIGRATIEEAWDASIGEGSGDNLKLLNGPVAAEGKVYTIDVRGEVRAFDLESGERIFSVDTLNGYEADRAFSGGLAYADGKIFAVTPGAEVVVLTADDGKILSRFKLSAPVRSAPTVVGDHIYVININNQTEVFDFNKQTPVWSHFGIMETVGLLGGASPTIDQGVAVVPYTSGEVYALLPSSGAVIWNETLVSQMHLDPVSTLYHIKAAPVIKNELTYLIGNSGVTRAVDLRSGQVMWSQKVGGIRTPAVSGNALFMISNGQELLCLNSYSGKVMWKHQLESRDEDKKKQILWTGPVIHNDTLVIASSQGHAMLINARDGSLHQEFKLGEGVYLPPILVDGKVIFLTDSGRLEVYR